MFKAPGNRRGGWRRKDQEEQTEKPVSLSHGMLRGSGDPGVVSRPELWGHNGKGTRKAQQVFDEYFLILLARGRVSLMFLSPDKTQWLWTESQFRDNQADSKVPSLPDQLILFPPVCFPYTSAISPSPRDCFL